MRKVLLLLLPVLLVSCEARLDDDTRAFFKTKIVDANGNPLRNASVEVTNFRTFELFPFNQSLNKFSQPERDFLLGKGKTNENGEVSFHMLFDTSSRYFINILGANNELKVVTTGIESFNDNLTLDIPLITIKEITDVQLDFINTSSNPDVIDVRINYFDPQCSEVFENNMFLVDPDCGFGSPIFTRINQTTNDGQFRFQAFYPSTITVVYTDSNGTELIEEFAVNNPNERYEINF